MDRCRCHGYTPLHPSLLLCHFSNVSFFLWKACNPYRLVNTPATYQNMLFPACKHVLKCLRKCMCLRVRNAVRKLNLGAHFTSGRQKNNTQ